MIKTCGRAIAQREAGFYADRLCAPRPKRARDSRRMPGIERRTIRSRTDLAKRTGPEPARQTSACWPISNASSRKRSGAAQCTSVSTKYFALGHGPNPAAVLICPASAQIDERTAEALREFASAGERHPRIGFTADRMDGTPTRRASNGPAKAELLRARGRDEQHADCLVRIDACCTRAQPRGSRSYARRSRPAPFRASSSRSAFAQLSTCGASQSACSTRDDRAILPLQPRLPMCALAAVQAGHGHEPRRPA